MTRRKNLISAKSLVARLQDPHVRIIDCRFNLGDPHAGRKAYHDAHLPGAVFADLDQDLSGPVRADSGRHPLPDRATIAATLGRLGIEKRSDVIVYDDGQRGTRGSRVVVAALAGSRQRAIAGRRDQRMAKVVPAARQRCGAINVAPF